MHLSLDKKEGYEFTAEELYEQIYRYTKGKSNSKNKVSSILGDSWDFHLSNEEVTGDSDDKVRLKWQQNLLKTAKLMETRSSGNIPAYITRIIGSFTKAKTDWRSLLHDFVQEEICDYSFTPPDRRYDDSPFFLPDYNELDYHPGKLLFMIDTSGSMSKEQITSCYSEICGAIEQFHGKIEGYLGFFDADVTPAKRFSDVTDLFSILPKGGGGTRFDIIFDYVKKEMADDPPLNIIILTDGYAPFPKEASSLGIPTLWMINNEAISPPWGITARI